MEGKQILCLALILFITTTSPVYCKHPSKTLPYKPLKEKVTHLHFYFHDTMSGNNPGAVLIARPNISVITDTGSTKLPFGDLFVIDDPITVGPEPTSELIGNARGLYVSSGKELATLTLVFYLDFGFTAGRFNGSSISVFSRDPVTDVEPHEVAVVGGRGVFRMAKGFAYLRTYSENATAGDGIGECNITVIHY